MPGRPGRRSSRASAPAPSPSDERRLPPPLAAFRDEDRELAALWTAYTEAQPDAAETKLRAFLNALVEKYEDWPETKIMSIGFPGFVIEGITSRLGAGVDALCDELRAPLKLTTVQRDLPLLCLRALNTCARFPLNTSAMAAHTSHVPVVAIGRTAYLGLEQMLTSWRSDHANERVRSGSRLDDYDQAPDVREQVLTLTTSFLVFSTDPHTQWTTHGATSSRSSTSSASSSRPSSTHLSAFTSANSPSLPSSAPSPSSSTGSSSAATPSSPGASSSRVDRSLVDLVVGSLRVILALSGTRPSPAQRQLQTRLLHAMGSFLYMHPECQDDFVQGRVLESLMSLLQGSNIMQDVYVDGDPQICEHQHSMLLLTLQFLRALFARNAAAVQRAQQLGVWDRLVHCMLWDIFVLKRGAENEFLAHVSSVERASTLPPMHAGGEVSTEARLELDLEHALSSPSGAWDERRDSIDELDSPVGASHQSMSPAQLPPSQLPRAAADQAAPLPTDLAVAASDASSFTGLERTIQTLMGGERFARRSIAAPNLRFPDALQRSTAFCQELFYLCLTRTHDDRSTMLVAETLFSALSVLFDPAIRQETCTRLGFASEAPLALVDMYLVDLLVRLVAAREVILETAHSTGLMTAFSQSVAHSSTFLQRAFVSMLMFSATITEHANANECRLLLTAATSLKPLSYAHLLLDGLRTIFLTNVKPTSIGLIDGGALALLPQLLRSLDELPSSPQVEACLAAAIAVVECVMTRSKNRMAALSHEEFVKSLFSLMHHPDLTRYVALKVLLLMKASSRLNLDERLPLFTHFQELLPRLMTLVHEGSERHFQMLLTILAVVRMLLRENSKVHQRTFRDSGTLLQVATVLNTDHKFDSQRLVLDVLSTLQSLLALNEKSKEFFRVEIGYDQLAQLIVNSLRPFSSVVFSPLLDLMVDGAFDASSQFAVQNPHVLRMFVMFYEHSSEAIKLEILDLLLTVASLCTRNLSYCVDMRLAERLLSLLRREPNEELQVKILRLVEFIGMHSVSVREVKALFSLMQSVKGDFRPRIWPFLIRALQNMASRDVPDSWIDFDGLRSHIILPHFDRWPSTRGYAITMWFRVEGFTQPSSPTARPYLFSLHSEARGIGMSAYFDSQCLVVEVQPRGKKLGRRVFPEMRFQPKTWYFLAIVQDQQRVLSSESEIRIYVDGALMGRGNLRYPNFGNEQLDRSSLGANLASGSVAESAFFGQLGPVYFFDDPLSMAIVKAIHALGFNYGFSFQQSDVGFIPAVFQPTVESLFTKVFLSFNPRAYRGKYLLDNSPENGLHVEPLPARLKNTNQVLTRGVARVIHTLGGVKIIFPLVAQLDQPMQPLDDMTPISYTPDPQRCAQVFGLLADLVSDSYSVVLSMQRSDACLVLGYLLQQVSRQHLSKPLILALDQICRACRLFTGQAAEKLLGDTYRMLLLDMRLWVMAPFEVQQQLWSLLSSHMGDHRSYFKTKLGLSLQYWLDVLRLFYWYDLDDLHSQGAVPLLHPVTKEINGQRPTQAQLPDLRQRVQALMLAFHSDGVDSQDVNALVGFLFECTDNRQLADVLMFTLQLCKLHPAPIWKAMRHRGKFNVLLRLTENETEEVRVLALKVIGQLFQSVPKCKKHADQILLGGFPAILKFPFSEVTYSALLMVLCESVSFHGTHIELDDEKVFANPSVLQTIFLLMRNCEPFRLQKAMQDIILLITNNSANQVAMLHCPFWQNWLFELLLNCRDDESNVLFELVMNLFRLLLYHAFKHDEAGFRTFQETLLLLELFSRKAELPVQVIIREFFVNILYCLQSELLQQSRMRNRAYVDQFFWIEYFAQNKAVPVLSNLVHILNLLEDFLFYGHLFTLPPDETPLSPPSTMLSSTSPLDDLSTAGVPPLKLNASSELQQSPSMTLFSGTQPMPAPQRRKASLSSSSPRAATLSASPPLLATLPHVDATELTADDLSSSAAPATLSAGVQQAGATNSSSTSEGGDTIRGSNAPGAPPTDDFDPPSQASSSSVGAATAQLVQAQTSAVGDASLHGSRSFSSSFDSPSRDTLTMRGHVRASGTMPADGSPEVTSHLHRTEYGDWEDLQLVDCVLRTLDMLGFTTNSDFSQMEQLILEGKIFIVMTNLREGGVPRIVLRLILSALQESSSTTYETNVNRLQAFLRNYVEDSSDGSDTRLLGILQFLISEIRSTRDLLSSGILSAEQALRLYETYVPVVREIFRKRKSVLNALLKPLGQSTEARWLRPNAPVDELVSVVSSGEWLTGLDMPIQHLAQKEEVREIQLAVRTAALWKRDAIELRRRALAQRQAMAERMRSSAAEIDEQFRLSCSTEHNRLTALLGSLNDRTRKAAHRWQHTIRSMTDEWSPWSIDEGEKHWKLDKTEDSSRRRLKLKRNYEFDPHNGAAQLVTTAEVDPTPEPPVVEKLSGIKFNQIGLEALEESGEWTVVEEEAPSTLVPSGLQQEEKEIASIECTMRTPKASRKGTLEITTQALYFRPDVTEDQDSERNWRLPEIVEIHFRRYQLRMCSFEMFLSDKTNYFLDFGNVKALTRAHQLILRQRPPNLVYAGVKSPQELFRRAKSVTERWQRRQITNFEYLMHLNTLAGRTYNDLSQYPVFPWVLKDYTSETIDLNDPAVYRDLSVPMGAMTEERLSNWLERYESMVGGEMPPFLYGTHYSTAAIVLFYLIRVEPFTSLAIELQGGRFDHADRMFWSLPQTFHNACTGPGDVKELIPEFYYMPELLVNLNHFVFGDRQTGQPFNDVLLPPWAKTPEEFIRINRAALESEYVSAHLHEWIDLIFGEKQRGEAAIKAHNVFHHLTYEGTVDIDAIEDEHLRRATIAQIDHFGQTPSQLLTRPHPPRGPPPPHVHSPLSLVTANSAVALRLVKVVTMPGSQAPVIAMQLREQTLVTVNSSRMVSTHRFAAVPVDADTPFTLEFDRTLTAGPRRHVGIPFAPGYTVHSGTVFVTRDMRMVLTVGHWDDSLRVSAIDTSRALQCVAKHEDLITCVGGTRDSLLVVTGSRDGTLMVWDMSLTGRVPLTDSPRGVLFGHNDEVCALAVDGGLDVVVSGSVGGLCLVHTLRAATVVRDLPIPEGSLGPIGHIAVSQNGYIVVYCIADFSLHVFTVNGKLLTSTSAAERLFAMQATRDGDFLISGGDRCQVVFRALPSLEVTMRVQVAEPVMSLCADERMNFVLAGLRGGSLCVMASQWQPSAAPASALPDAHF